MGALNGEDDLFMGFGDKRDLTVWVHWVGKYNE
jgi:hypothetical protein